MPLSSKSFSIRSVPTLAPNMPLDTSLALIFDPSLVFNLDRLCQLVEINNHLENIPIRASIDIDCVSHEGAFWHGDKVW